MKYIEIEDIDKLPGKLLKEGDNFNFRCYPGIACFNRCLLTGMWILCRDLPVFSRKSFCGWLKTKKEPVRFWLNQAARFILTVRMHAAPFLLNRVFFIMPNIRKQNLFIFSDHLSSVWVSTKKKPGQFEHGQMTRTLFCIIK